MGHAVDDRLWMHQNINLRGINFEQIGCFDKFERLVHQRCAVDGILDSHGPVGMGGRFSRSRTGHLVP